ncbi:MAG: TolC family protein [bacterium]
MLRSITPLLAGLLCTAGAGSAAAETLSLSQEQAARHAVARHPLVKAAGHATAGAKARVEMAKTGWLPRARIEGGYMLMGPVQRLHMELDPGIPGIDPIVIDNQLGSLHNASVGLTLAWRAVDFGARDVLASAAQAAAAASKAEGRERAAKIAYAARAAYLATLFFEELAKVTQRSLNVALAEQREQRLRKKAGVGDDLSLARADIRIAELQSRVTRARLERARALVNLRLLLGLKSSTTLRLTDSLKALGSAPLPAAQPKRHPTRMKLAALQRATRLEVKRLGRTWWPTIDVIGQLKYQYPKNYFENDRAGLFYSVGVMVTWNVFDGDLIRRQRMEARAKVSEVRSLTRAADEEISRTLVDAGAHVRIAASSVRSAKQTLEAADVYLRAARVSVKAGTGTALELRKAEEAVDQARLGEIKAYFDGALARAARLLALGKESNR